MDDFSTRSTELSPVIGLTGGIGSGKSTVAKIFQSLGVPTFNADEVAKSCYRRHPELRNWVVATFGQACGVIENGSLIDINRAALASAVFDNPTGLNALNAQVHPLVQLDFTRWHAQQSRHPSVEYVVREAAILFESGTHVDCARIITVQADEDLRVLRAAHRLGVAPDEIRNRIQRQWTDKKRAQHAHFALDNNAENALLPQVLRVHERLLEELSGRK